MSSTEASRRYWRRNLWTIGALLVVWVGVTFVVPGLAYRLSVTVFGTPFGFWMASQGAPILYVVIVGLYAWRMRRLDRSSAVDEDLD